MIPVTSITKLKKPLALLLKGDTVALFHHEKGSSYCVIEFANGESKVAALCDLDIVGKNRPAPIAKASESRSKENKIYLTLRKVFLENHKTCEANLSDCKILADQVHHASGRCGKKLVDVNTFIALCFPCHQHIENNPEWAKENGYSTNRL